MIENEIKIINTLDSEIQDLEDEIKKNIQKNEKIKLNIQKKLIILEEINNILETQGIN